MPDRIWKSTLICLLKIAKWDFSFKGCIYSPYFLLILAVILKIYSKNLASLLFKFFKLEILIKLGHIKIYTVIHRVNRLQTVCSGQAPNFRTTLAANQVRLTIWIQIKLNVIKEGDRLFAPWDDSLSDLSDATHLSFNF